MNSNVTGCKALNWVAGKARPQITWPEGDFFGAEIEIPGSGEFEGRLPARMVSEIVAYAKARGTVKDLYKAFQINFEENGNRWVISYGAYNTTRNNIKVSWLPVAFLEAE